MVCGFVILLDTELQNAMKHLRDRPLNVDEVNSQVLVQKPSVPHMQGPCIKLPHIRYNRTHFQGPSSQRHGRRILVCKTLLPLLQKMLARVTTVNYRDAH
ncbi:hypothetical protein XELAEV_18018096mg [Xenopus laevis]|uniref:Uncharacterized protein n=1 Tax=Xenopus laevis TaxID=8355 RepID=A0A974DEH4_XENLA|nr:hypothetical protein XELAEV_18018096mg [Xenopus laevis]